VPTPQRNLDEALFFELLPIPTRLDDPIGVEHQGVSEGQRDPLGEIDGIKVPQWRSAPSLQQLGAGLSLCRSRPQLQRQDKGHGAGRASSS
jgi:hypothetical protein